MKRFFIQFCAILLCVTALVSFAGCEEEDTKAYAEKYRKQHAHSQKENDEMQEEYTSICGEYIFNFPEIKEKNRLKGDYYRIDGLDQDYLYYNRTVPENIVSGLFPTVRYTDHDDWDFGLAMRKEAQSPFARYGIKKVRLIDTSMTVSVIDGKEERDYFRDKNISFWESTDTDVLNAFYTVLTDQSKGEIAKYAKGAIIEEPIYLNNVFPSAYLFFELNTECRMIYVANFFVYENSVYVMVQELVRNSDKAKDELGYYYQDVNWKFNMTPYLDKNNPDVAALYETIQAHKLKNKYAGE